MDRHGFTPMDTKEPILPPMLMGAFLIVSVSFVRRAFATSEISRRAYR